MTMERVEIPRRGRQLWCHHCNLRFSRERCPHCYRLLCGDCFSHICGECSRDVGLCCEHRLCPSLSTSYFESVPSASLGRFDSQRRLLAVSANDALPSGFLHNHRPSLDMAARVGCSVAVCDLCRIPGVATNGLRVFARQSQVLYVCDVCCSLQDLRALAPDLHYAEWVSLRDCFVALHGDCRAAADRNHPDCCFSRWRLFERMPLQWWKRLGRRRFAPGAAAPRQE